MLQVHSVEVDRTQDFVDFLNIPWWGQQDSDGNAFVPGRITSFTAIERSGELFMVVWWDQPQPNQEELQAAVDKYCEELYSDEESQ